MFYVSEETGLAAIRTISCEVLREYPTDEVAYAGVALQWLLADFRRDHSDQVPMRPDTGLLRIGPTPFNDFELAQHLERTANPAMVRLQKTVGRVPCLMAYMLVVATDAHNERNLGVDAALRYAVDEASVRLETTRRLQKIAKSLEPLAAHGKLFIEGRKLGTPGPIAKRIKAHLVKYPTSSAREVWAALKKSPPTGFAFMETTKLGWYIEKGARTVMEWRRFQNLVSEHRPSK